MSLSDHISISLCQAALDRLFALYLLWVNRLHLCLSQGVRNLTKDTAPLQSPFRSSKAGQQYPSLTTHAFHWLLAKPSFT